MRIEVYCMRHTQHSTDTEIWARNNDTKNGRPIGEVHEVGAVGAYVFGRWS